MSSPTYRIDDEDTSSLSDYDSEWTQVSGMEDDDFPPLSAASDRSSSHTDIVDGNLNGDVWEGLADGLHRISSRLSEIPSSVDDDATRELTSEDARSLGASVATKVNEDDDRVSVALNSSVVGTLRASRTRSASSSLHASLTESQSKLRLSFPDPLTSSKDEIVDESDPRPLLKDQNNIDDPYTSSVSSSFTDIEGPATLEASEKSDKSAVSTNYQPIPIYASCILSIIIYGSASSSRWQIVDKVLSLVLQYRGPVPAFVEDGCSRRYYYEASVLRIPGASQGEQLFVRIIDRTACPSGTEFTDTDDGVPSLAIVLLPSSLPSCLPKHDYYLPLINPPSLNFGFSTLSNESAFSESVVSDSAQYAWECLEVPHEKLIVLDPRRPNTIWDVTFFNDQEEEVLVTAFSVIFSGGRTRTNISNNQEKQHAFVNKWYTLAIVAATALAVAFGGIRVNKLSAETTISSDMSNINLSTTNSIAVGSSSNIDLLPISPIDSGITSANSALRSLATVAVKSLTTQSSYTKSLIRDPPPVSTSDIGRSNSDHVLGTKESERSICDCLRRPKAWLDRLDIGFGDYVRKDLIDRPTTALSLIGKSPVDNLKAPKQVARDDAKKSPMESTALSLRAVHNSIAQFSSKSKSLLKSSRADIHTINEALDDLLLALGRQVDRAKAGMDKARAGALDVNYHMRHTLVSRNARARENARRIRRVGERFFKAAGEGALRIASQVRDRKRTNNEEAFGPYQSKQSCREPDGHVSSRNGVPYQGTDKIPEEKQQETEYSRHLHRRIVHRERMNG